MLYVSPSSSFSLTEASILFFLRNCRQLAKVVRFLLQSTSAGQSLHATRRTSKGAQQFSSACHFFAISTQSMTFRLPSGFIVRTFLFLFLCYKLLIQSPILIQSSCMVSGMLAPNYLSWLYPLQSDHLRLKSALGQSGANQKFRTSAVSGATFTTLNSQRSSGRYWKSQILKDLPSRELTYATRRRNRKSLTQKCLGRKYVSSQEDKYICCFFLTVTFASRVCDHLVFFVFFWGSCWFFGPFWPRWSLKHHRGGFSANWSGSNGSSGRRNSSLPPFHLGQASLLKPVEDAEEDA